MRASNAESIKLDAVWQFRLHVNSMVFDCVHVVETRPDSHQSATLRRAASQNLLLFWRDPSRFYSDPSRFPGAPL